MWTLTDSDLNSSVSDAESISSVDTSGSTTAQDEADRADDIVPDEDLVIVNEVSCVLGSSAHKLPDVACESVDEESQRVREISHAVVSIIRTGRATASSRQRLR